MRTRQQQKLCQGQGPASAAPTAPAPASSTTKPTHTQPRHSGSALLNCFAHLDDAAWAHCLLPMLVESGAARSVALTCSTLRQLVQRNWQALNFETLAVSKVQKAEAMTATLPTRFPAAETVRLQLSTVTSYLVAQALMPALSRLPRLNHLILLNTPHPSPTAMAMQLAQIRAHLPHLRRLTLVVAENWLAASAAWQQLGSITQLTRIELRFTTQTNRAFQMRDLAELAGLRGLQHLAVTAQRVCTKQQHSGLQFLGRLTALSALDLQLPTAKGLSTISRCSRLRRLLVQQVPQAQYRLKPTLPKSLQHLTKLTQLELGYHLLPDAVPLLHSALKQLPQLQRVSAVGWQPDVLPVFAALTKLTAVEGPWQEAASGGSSSSRHVAGSCPHVSVLLKASGPVPFRAFPKLLRCTYDGSFTPSALKGLQERCPRLQVLSTVSAAAAQGSMEYEEDGSTPVATGAVPDWTSLPLGAALTDRVAAARSLSRLPALQSLGWHAQDNAEVAALANGLTAVTNLVLVVPEGSLATMNSLVQLGRLPALQQLELHLLEPISQAEAQMLLCSLGRVPRVSVAGLPLEVMAVRAARAWAATAGLEVPTVTLIEYPETSDDESSSEDEHSDSSSGEEDDDNDLLGL